MCGPSAIPIPKSDVRFQTGLLRHEPVVISISHVNEAIPIPFFGFIPGSRGIFDAERYTLPSRSSKKRS
jgi:hypothetical protein